MSDRSHAFGDRSWQQYPNGMCLKRLTLAGAKMSFRNGQTVARVECDGIDALAEGYFDV